MVILISICITFLLSAGNVCEFSNWMSFGLLLSGLIPYELTLWKQKWLCFIALVVTSFLQWLLRQQTCVTLPCPHTDSRHWTGTDVFLVIPPCLSEALHHRTFKWLKRQAAWRGSGRSNDSPADWLPEMKASVCCPPQRYNWTPVCASQP